MNEINEYKEKLKLNKSIFASFARPIYQANIMMKNIQKDIENQKKALEEFNDRYKTNLDGNEITIKLNYKNIDDDGIKLLAKIKFPRLEKLKLRGNQISDIGPLMRIVNKNTKKFDLSLAKAF